MSESAWTDEWRHVAAAQCADQCALPCISTSAAKPSLHAGLLLAAHWYHHANGASRLGRMPHWCHGCLTVPWPPGAHQPTAAPSITCMHLLLPLVSCAYTRVYGGGGRCSCEAGDGRRWDPRALHAGHRRFVASTAARQSALGVAVSSWPAPAWPRAACWPGAAGSNDDMLAAWCRRRHCCRRGTAADASAVLPPPPPQLPLFRF